MGSKKTLTFFYSIYNPTIIELNYINKLINYIKKNQLLTEEIDIVIFDDTDNNKYKNYFMDNKVKVLNVQENVKKNKALFYSIDKINSKYLKIVDPDDFLVFDFLEKVINKLKLIDADFILHPFFKLKDNKIKYQNFKEVRYYNFNTIYSVDKIKKEKNLINIDLLYNQDQYLGMIVDLNSSYQKINIPFYIYNRNSFSSI
jgi:cellulose synthase/poly-beta-1,6-N-acetylglucosamine synthase-like glycosyltransferase